MAKMQAQMTRQQSVTAEDNKLHILLDDDKKKELHSMISQELTRGSPQAVGAMLLRNIKEVQKVCGEDMRKTQTVILKIYSQWQDRRGQEGTYEEFIEVLKKCQRNDIVLNLKEEAKNVGDDLSGPFPVDVMLIAVSPMLSPADIHALGTQLLGNYVEVQDAKLTDMGTKATPAEQMDAIFECWIRMGKGQPKDLVRAVRVLKEKKLEDAVQAFVDGLEKKKEKEDLK